MRCAIDVRVQHGDFEPGAELAALTDNRETVGAVTSFVGHVRGGAGSDGLVSMTLEHYPGMTEKALQRIALQAAGRWSLSAVGIIHRVGRLLPGERIVWVGVASAHRGEAFAACEFVMDYLKTQAPFWKCEERLGAGLHWVDARESDHEAALRWKTEGQ